MQVRESDETHVVLDMSHNELILVNNALKEVCHGINLPSFSTHVGAERDELEALLRQVAGPLEGMVKQKDEG